jgi:hypothetical protein
MEHVLDRVAALDAGDDQRHRHAHPPDDRLAAEDLAGTGYPLV